MMKGRALMSISRRAFLVASLTSVSLAGCQTIIDGAANIPKMKLGVREKYLRVPEGEKFKVEPIAYSKINPKYQRQVVFYPTTEEPGTIIVDPYGKFLYLVEGGGQARRYGIGVGRAGFGWNGEAVVKFKREWPDWYPPKEMQERDERARLWKDGMPGGPANPIGARGLYLWQDNKDTLYRIHGTREVASIGRNVSSGCIRMLNADVIDLYNRVETGAKVIVKT